MSEIQQEENLQESTDNVEEIEVIEEEQKPEENQTEESVETSEEEVKADSEDELENYSENVQKRINNLTRKLREAERVEILHLIMLIA